MIKGNLKPKKAYDVKAAFILTSDKVYFLFMAGASDPFSKLEPAFDKAVESVKLSF